MSLLSKTAAAGVFLALNGLAIEPRPADSAFFRIAVENSMFEIQTGELAELRSPSDPVKQYATRMTSDYGTLLDQLKSIAARDNFAVPDDIGSRNQSTLHLLIEISGPAPLSLPAFDQVFMSEMIGAHQSDIAAFAKESTSGLNPDLRTWIASALPVLREQLRLARNTQNYLGSVSQVVKKNN